MPQQGDEQAIRALEDKILAVYGAAQARIDAEQQAIVDNPRKFRRRARLAEMQHKIDTLMGDVDQQAAQWLDEDLPRVFDMGANRASSQTAQIVGSAAARQLDTFTQADRAAVSRIADELHQSLLAATTHVSDTTKALIREGVRQGVIGSVVGGSTPITEARRLAQALVDDHGIHAVVYRDGSRHQLADYAQVAVRTQTALAYNQGIFASASAEGIGFMEVLDGPACGWDGHDDPDHAAGSIRPVAECDATPISHPNCRRSFGPRPDVVANDGSGDSPAARFGLPTTPLSEAAPFWSAQTPSPVRSGPAPTSRTTQRANKLAQRQQGLDQRATSRIGV